MAMEAPGTTDRPPAPVSGAKRVNVFAIISVAAGVASFALGFIIVGAIVAIITGYLARRQIARTGERGNELALIGLILGYVHMVLFLGWFGLIFLVRIASAVNGNG